MAFKFLISFAVIAVASAGLIPLQQHEYAAEHQPIYHSAPATHVSAPQHVILQKHHGEHEQYPDDPHPQYNFAYDVQDAVSGDSKSQTESRDGDVVHGEYSLTDADGFRRTVKYTADSVNGFNAVVHREPLTHKVVAAAAVPVHQYQHAPAVTAVKAPVAYVAPTYASLPAHHEQHNQYATYESPEHNGSGYYHH
ncbi:larval cuticle protein A2B-like [Teleopsis dalmanni]|uniref:larval cuticle protein A2B-like n=1 Tax=Teleopsis dalmanni TaxID=139649 RepID=UPI0018CE527B|nr:larval cuticle protein A2B-like [Teleopsis dalmanni]